MSKRKYNKPFPLTMLQNLTSTYPTLWDAYDIVRDVRGVDYINLSDSGSVMEYIMERYGVNSTNRSVDAHIVYAFGAWRRYKEIYSVDSQLVEILTEDKGDIHVPVDVLRNLPYPAFYVQVGDNPNGKDGFFVTKADEQNKIYFFKLNSSGYGISVPILLENGITVEESIKKTIRSENPDYDMNQHGAVVEFLKYAIQIVMYICTINADVCENPEQKKITKRSDSYKTKPKDSYGEIRKWDVGYRIGKIIRESKLDHQNESTGRKYSKSSMKRPHTRRGHFHHFWVGSKSDGSRKLVLKWVAPMFINMQCDELPAIINHIDKRSDVT